MDTHVRGNIKDPDMRCLFHLHSARARLVKGGDMDIERIDAATQLWRSFINKCLEANAHHDHLQLSDTRSLVEPYGLEAIVAGCWLEH